MSLLLICKSGAAPYQTVMSDFLNDFDEILTHGSMLPHWQQGEVMQFVTFRLADAMPATRLRQWQEEHAISISLHPKPWTPGQEKEYHSCFTWKIEGWLDEGAGSCLFQNPEHRAVMA